jgi:glycosyltransferase involved in cell wall biosynthesis
MKKTVAIYCPDQHIQYDLHTLDEIGVGGGVTARVRMAHALAQIGHDVTLYINCPKEGVIQGVRYQHFSKGEHFSEKIFIASTSGGNLNLGSLIDKKIDTKFKFLMVHGVSFPEGIAPAYFDAIYALSNFVREISVKQWKIDPGKVFVTHRGVKTEFYKLHKAKKRNPFHLVYCGHPSKGLDAAIEVMKVLRHRDQRYKLNVFGGSRLWGETEEKLDEQPGVVFHGLVGQKQLAQELMGMGFSLNLQSREEPFGMVLIESMRAGCIVIASEVGAFPELIRNGHNGFLIPGYRENETIMRVANTILDLNQNPAYSEYIRRNAVSSPLTWEVVAQAWSGYWDWMSGSRIMEADDSIYGSCSVCGGNWLLLADGLHCTECGYYQNGA